jgi:chitinase
LIKLLDSNLDLDNIKKFTALKQLNPALKTLVAIGGWNVGSAKFSQLAKQPEKRSAFAKEAREFVLKHGFDGLDVDWEYPGKLLNFYIGNSTFSSYVYSGQRDGDPGVDKQNFVLLLQDIRAAYVQSNF